MAHDMLVALGRATEDGRALFGHNCNGHGGCAMLERLPQRTFAPGETVPVPHLQVPQVRQTHAVLAGRSTGWGHDHGVNEKGVAAGWTATHTQLENARPGLSGPELVRLVLERASSARQAVQVLEDLIGRYGQGASPGAGGQDSAFLVADAREAYLLEACGGYWVQHTVGSVRAVSGACMLRQDWDRIAPGLSGVAIARGWWPEDGCKLDFAEAVGRQGPDHARALLRWGRATVALEHASTPIESGTIRQVLAEQAAMVEAEGAEQTLASLIVELAPGEGAPPLAWWSAGPPMASVYLPLTPAAPLPVALAASEPDSLGTTLAGLREEARRDRLFEADLHAALQALQHWLDAQAREFIAETAGPWRLAPEELARQAGSFTQGCCEHVLHSLAELRGATEPVGAAESPESPMGVF
jgi:secernin